MKVMGKIMGFKGPVCERGGISVGLWLERFLWFRCGMQDFSDEERGEG